MKAFLRRQLIDRDSDSNFLEWLKHLDRAGLKRRGEEGERKPTLDHAATVRFYAELNDFLLPAHRQAAFVRKFHGTPSIKDLIESLGVPHTEIDLILVNGETQSFSYHVRHGDRISVFPVFESFDVTSLERLRPRPLREPRFVLDIHLGRLAAYLRMLGFDAVYRNDFDDDELISLAGRERRILITRDRQLPKRKAVTHAYCVRDVIPRLQAVEVLRRFDLVGSVAPFRRCLACDGLLEAAEASRVSDRVPPGVAREHAEYAVCPGCRRVYWKGSHHRRMLKLVNELIEAAASPAPVVG